MEEGLIKFLKNGGRGVTGQIYNTYLKKKEGGEVQRQGGTRYIITPTMTFTIIRQ